MSDELEVRAKRAGTWLTFTTATGKTATLRIETLAKNKVGIVGMALRQWCRERQAEVATICPRCDERIEKDCVPDGCRDPDCPMQVEP